MAKQLCEFVGVAGETCIQCAPQTLVSPGSLRPVRLRHNMGHKAPNLLCPEREKALAWSQKRPLCFQAGSRVAPLLRAAMLQPRVPLGGNAAENVCSDSRTLGSWKVSAPKAAWDRLRKASIEELRGEGTLPVFIRSCRSARLIEVTVCVMRGKCYRL